MTKPPLYTRENLLQSMDVTGDDVEVKSVQGWIRHAKEFLPSCLAKENIIACDVDVDGSAQR